jgi:S-adenosylmethionine:tRNA ribosyltransferase-isomerase
VTERGTCTSDYDFPLPADRIAQAPLERRDESRLMVVDRSTGRVAHRIFRDIAELIAPGDALVLNTTRVIRARLLGTRDSGAPGEVLLLRPLGEGRYEAMVSPGGKLRPGRTLHVAPGFDVDILEATERRTRIVRLRAAEGSEQAIERYGRTPLPPYIARRDTPADAERYQTVYARDAGSAAAPTAGLHFTPEVLARLDVERVTLHVGLDTFRPINVDELEEHTLHGERYEVTREAWERIEVAPRVLAVGTTTVRVLETLARGAPLIGRTELFVTPGFEFKRVDALLTNFHLPRSTLLALVMAFAGVEETRALYREAIEREYRFYSFGDAMLVL